MGLSAKKDTSEGRVVIKKKSFLFREKNARKKYCYRKSCYVLAPRGAYSSPEKHGLIREGGLILRGGVNRGFTVPVFRNRQYDDATLRCTSENGVEQHDHHGQRLIAVTLDIVLRCRES